jgi:hypothetical protein
MVWRAVYAGLLAFADHAVFVFTSAAISPLTPRSAADAGWCIVQHPLASSRGYLQCRNASAALLRGLKRAPKSGELISVFSCRSGDS